MADDEVALRTRSARHAPNWPVISVFFCSGAHRERRRFASVFESSTKGDDAGHNQELSW
jgi:hypothetical protein